MSYFNFKLYTRSTKNVNTDLEYKKGDWAPGNPQKGGRAPILGYRKNLDCSGATGCQNETIYKDNWAKTCATDPSSCYVPVINTIQNKRGKIDNDYNYNTRNLLRSRFRTYEQNAYNFDLGRKYASAWPTSFDLTVFATDFPINVGPNPQIAHFDASFNLWTRSTITFGPYNPVYQGPIDESGNAVYMTLAPSLPSIPAQIVIRWNLFKTADEKNGFENMIAYDLSHDDISGSKVYSYIVNAETDPFITTENLTPDDVGLMFNITGWPSAPPHPAISNLKYELNKQPLSNSVYYLGKYYSHLTNWGGGADPANNAYLIHDCSCNAPFTANNPCVATYAPSNRKFAVNNAVSGRSRINRLKYNTITKVKSTKSVPFSLLGYPRGSCEFCKRDFKPSKGKKGGDNKERIKSRLPVVYWEPSGAAAAVTCCSESLPAGVIKLCTGFNSGSNCGGAVPYLYDTVGYLKDAQPEWTNSSGCAGWDPTPVPPTTGRLGNYDPGYPDIGTMCPPDAAYRTTNVIGGFAWNPVDEHLWFILKDPNRFNPLPPPAVDPSGFQFTAIEFSSSPSFPPANTTKLYASDNVAPNVDYDTGSPYEIHWSSGVTGWATALPKIINIFGDGSVTKNVYIQFDLAVFGPVPGGFTATPGASPSYITIQYNQSLDPNQIPNDGNFTIINTQTGVTISNNILGVKIITNTMPNDTIELEFAEDAIYKTSPITYSYTNNTPPYITNLAGSHAANISNQSITASGDPLTNTNWITEVDIILSGNTSAYGPIGIWDVSQVTDMANTFNKGRNIDAEHFNEDISSWNTSIVTNMTSMFNGAAVFNQDILGPGKWVTPAVTTMESMFEGANTFANGGTAVNVVALGRPYVGPGNGGVSCKAMFKDCLWTVPNIPDLSNDFTSYITNMSSMFEGTTNFPESGYSISSWTTAQVTTMESMFEGAVDFDDDISSWDTISVTDMSSMFQNTTSFDQDLSTWRLDAITLGTDLSGCFNGSGLSGQTWVAGDSAGGVANSWYTKATTLDPSNFYTDGADGASPTAGSQPELILPPITNANFLNIVDVWLNTTASPYGNISTWDVSLVTNMASTFSATRNSNAANFVGDISLWTTVQVTTMEKMFYGAAAFVADIGGWNTSSVINMDFLFDGATNFNKDISSWTLTGITSTFFMFRSAENFNQDISSWNVSNVQNFYGMFYNAKAFNQDISNWVVSSATNMNSMFGMGSSGISNFNNGDTGNSSSNPLTWTTSAVTDMSYMFQSADKFNQDISSWDTSSVTTMRLMFIGTSLFNQNIGNWDTSQTTDMKSMFKNAAVFNQDLSTWDLTNITADSQLEECFSAANGLSGQTWNAVSSSGGEANSWYTKATTLDPSSFYSDGASGAFPTGASQPELTLVVTSWTDHGPSAREWQDIASDLSGNKLFAIERGNISNNNPWYSYNGGIDWTQGTSLSGNKEFKSIACDDDGQIVVVAQYNYYIQVSNDSGLSYGANSGTPQEPWSSLALSSDGTKIFACSSGGFIYTGTYPFSVMTARATAILWRDITMSASGVIGAATTYGAGAAEGIYYTNDSGVTWTKNTTNSLSGYSITSSADGNNMAIVVYGGDIYTSTPGSLGGVWNARNVHGGTNYWSTIASDISGVRLIAAIDGFNSSSSSKGFVFTSSNSGVNWSQDTLAPAKEWKSIVSNNSGERIAVVDNGAFTPGKIWLRVGWT